MSEIIQAPEKTFKHFSELPCDVRIMISDEMNPVNRCRFSGCSKSSNLEAKASKNYMHTLQFKSSVPAFIIGYSDLERNNDEYASYLFKASEGEKCMGCDSERGWLWTTRLDDSADLLRYSIEHFKGFLKLYQNTIKELDIFGAIPNDIDFEISSLRKLETLKVTGNIHGLEILSKTRRPLKELEISLGGFDELNLEKIFQVQQKLDVPSLQLNNSQFLQLSATNITIHIGQLTPEYIFNFLKSWRSGKITREVKEIQWRLENSNFNAEQFFRLFGAVLTPTNRILSGWLEHFEQPQKLLHLVFFRERSLQASFIDQSI